MPIRVLKQSLGIATVSRWERGVLIQNEANDRFLRLLQFPDNVDRLRGERQPAGDAA